jgi:AraC-like DNA-binding protein
MRRLVMTGTASTIPYVRYDTTPHPPQRRLAAWREAIDVLFDVRPAEPAAAESPVVLDNWLLGEAVLAVGTGPGFSYHRAPRAIARDGRDLFMLQIYQAGQCRIVDGAPELVTEPGDLLVTDAASPIRTEETTFRNINLMVPRAMLAARLREPDAQGGRVLHRDLPLVALLRAHLSEIVRHAPSLPPAQAPDVLSATVQLVAAAINGGPDVGTTSGVQQVLVCQLRRYIAQHLHDRDLGPESLAARFGLSRATLYRLFEADGGVRRYVQRRRLDRARLDLADPAQHHRSIAEVGRTAGYCHAQDFTRAYRKEFAINPGAQRDHARAEARTRLGRAASERPIWVEWVRGLN